jgi:hypothetical protein
MIDSTWSVFSRIKFSYIDIKLDQHWTEMRNNPAEIEVIGTLILEQLKEAKK